MIPPLKDMRLRSITRWLADQKRPSAEQSSRATSLDEQMMEAFDQREDEIKASMMHSKTWGTEAGLREFPMRRMEAWQSVVDEFLPTTSDQSQAG